MFRLGYPELFIIFIIAVRVFAPMALHWLRRPNLEDSNGEPTANKAFFAALAILLGVFALVELWLIG